MTAGYSHFNQIGGVIINPDEGNNEYDYVITASPDHQAGTVLYTLDVFLGAEVYSRGVPNTKQWRDQALHDMTEAAKARHPGDTVYLHIDAD